MVDLFLLTLGSVLLRLSWLAFHSDWAVPSIQPLLYISVLGILGLGQTVDAFHDGIVSNEAANDLGTNIILEETTELFAAWVLSMQRGFGTIEIQKWHFGDNQRFKTFSRPFLLGIGNSF